MGHFGKGQEAKAMWAGSAKPFHSWAEYQTINFKIT